MDAGDSLTYTASGLPAWLSFDAATRTFTGTPANTDVGTITITVRATDGSAAFVEDQFDITVSNTNDAPTVANAIPDQGATEDAAFNFHFAANTFADVDAGDVVVNWDPHTHPIITEVAGTLKFVDFVDGVTVQSQTDDVTGLTSLVVMDPKQRPSSGKDLRPMVKLLDAKGTKPASVLHRELGELMLDRCGMAIGMATDEIAPADRKLYALRDQTGTVVSSCTT